MTKRTKQSIIDRYPETDPKTQYTDLLDSVPNFADAGSGYAVYVGKGGDDTGGNGSKINPYLTIQKALNEATGNKKTVFVEPGTYEENITWPDVSNVRLVGQARKGAVVIDGPDSGGTAVFGVSPTQAGFNLFLESVSIKHAGTGVYLDNGSCAGTMLAEFKDVEFLKDGGTSLITTGGSAQPVRVLMEGSGEDVGGEVNLTLKHAADNFIARQVRLSGGLVTSADDVVAELTLERSEVLHEGVSGGHASQVLNAVFCHSRTGETLALLDTADLAGSHTENIIGS